MSTAVVSRYLGRIATTASVARCSRTQCMHIRGQKQSFSPAMRSFSASSQAFAKRYTEDHEWIELSDDKSTGTIGISTYAAKALGDVVYVELPQIDLEVSQHDSIGAVESVKSASDIMTPVSGTIVEINGALEQKPATINSSPEGEGWLAKIKISDSAEVDALMDAKAYEEFTDKAE